MTGADRVPCIVPFCRRTMAADKLAPYREHICMIHWRAVSARTKWIRRRVKAKVARIGWTPAMQVLEGRTWDRAKRQAIEAAGGIA
jgi:hypothetical protein